MERRMLKNARNNGKKDLTKGIGMHKIMSKMERKKIQQIRRQKRREKRLQQKSACTQNDSDNDLPQ